MTRSVLEEVLVMHVVRMVAVCNSSMPCSSGGALVTCLHVCLGLIGALSTTQVLGTVLAAFPTRGSKLADLPASYRTEPVTDSVSYGFQLMPVLAMSFFSWWCIKQCLIIMASQSQQNMVLELRGPYVSSGDQFDGILATILAPRNVRTTVSAHCQVSQWMFWHNWKTKESDAEQT